MHSADMVEKSVHVCNTRWATRILKKVVFKGCVFFVFVEMCAIFVFLTIICFLVF